MSLYISKSGMMEQLHSALSGAHEIAASHTAFEVTTEPYSVYTSASDDNILSSDAYMVRWCGIACLKVCDVSFDCQCCQLPWTSQP